MNKLERITLYLIIIIVCVITSVLLVNKTKEVDYYCKFTYYDGGSVHWIVVDDYEKDGSIIKVYKTNGDLWEIDSEDYRVKCIEMEVVSKWLRED